MQNRSSQRKKRIWQSQKIHMYNKSIVFVFEHCRDFSGYFGSSGYVTGPFRIQNMAVFPQSWQRNFPMEKNSKYAKVHVHIELTVLYTAHFLLKKSISLVCLLEVSVYLQHCKTCTVSQGHLCFVCHGQQNDDC